MPHTLAELALTPVYRQAQRLLADWLEHGKAKATTSRQHAFRTRAALSRLDPGDRHRLARWLAWVQAADLSHGPSQLAARIQYLDPALGSLLLEAACRLPATVRAISGERRRSA